MAAPGVPLRVAVPSPLFVKVTPVGSAPVLVIVVAVGDPLVMIVNVPRIPVVNVVALELVITGAVAAGCAVVSCVTCGAGV